MVSSNVLFARRFGRADEFASSPQQYGRDTRSRIAFLSSFVVQRLVKCLLVLPSVSFFFPLIFLGDNHDKLVNQQVV
jgi:hypothetical protein